MDQVKRYTVFLEDLSKVKCKNPQVTVHADCMTLPCEFDYNTMSQEVEIIDNCGSPCITFTITCPADECHNCQPIIVKKCFCEGPEDCQDCEKCEDNWCVSICPPGQKCNDGCVDCINDNDCPCNKVCTPSGKCVCPPGLVQDPNNPDCCIQCINDDDCPDCEECVPGRGCSPKCPNGLCIEDECVECISSGDCKDKDPNSCCSDDNKCECCPGYIYDPVLKKCVEKGPCERDEDCPVCKICTPQGCVDKCPPGYICKNDECLLECDCDNPECPRTQKCSPVGLGKCACIDCSGPCTEVGDCPNGCFCDTDEQVCKPNPCNDVVCNTGDDCGEGCGCYDRKCIPCDSVGCLEGDITCDQIDGCICQGADTCVENPCKGPCDSPDDCGPGCGCQDGQCVACADLNCQANECDQVPGCRCLGQTCVTDPCDKPCNDGNDCGEGCGCDQTTGRCRSCQSADCFECDQFDGCICKNGQDCVDDPCNQPCQPDGSCPQGCYCDGTGNCKNCFNLSCDDNAPQGERCDTRFNECRCVGPNCAGVGDPPGDGKYWVCTEDEYEDIEGCAQVLFVIDQSSTMVNYAGSVQAIVDQTANLLIGQGVTEIGYLLFSESVDAQNFVTNGVWSGVSFTPGGCTNYTDALTQAPGVFAGTCKDKYIIFITDGLQNTQQGGPKCTPGEGPTGSNNYVSVGPDRDAVNIVAGYNSDTQFMVVPFGIGITGAYAGNFLTALAGGTDNVFSATGIGDLKEILEDAAGRVGKKKVSEGGCIEVIPGDPRLANNPVFKTQAECEAGCKEDPHTCKTVISQGSSFSQCVRDANGEYEDYATCQEEADCANGALICPPTPGDECLTDPNAIPGQNGAFALGKDKECRDSCICDDFDAQVTHNCTNGLQITVETAPGNFIVIQDTTDVARHGFNIKLKENNCNCDFGEIDGTTRNLIGEMLRDCNYQIEVESEDCKIVKDLNVGDSCCTPVVSTTTACNAYNDGDITVSYSGFKGLSVWVIVKDAQGNNLITPYSRTNDEVDFDINVPTGDGSFTVQLCDSAFLNPDGTFDTIDPDCECCATDEVALDCCCIEGTVDDTQICNLNIATITVADCATKFSSNRYDWEVKDSGGNVVASGTQTGKTISVDTTNLPSGDYDYVISDANGNGDTCLTIGSFSKLCCVGMTVVDSCVNNRGQINVSTNPSVNGIPVDLKDYDGNIIQSKTTDAGGNIVFSDVNDGDYEVTAGTSAGGDSVCPADNDQTGTISCCPAGDVTIDFDDCTCDGSADVGLRFNINKVSTKANCNVDRNNSVLDIEGLDGGDAVIAGAIKSYTILQGLPGNPDVLIVVVDKAVLTCPDNIAKIRINGYFRYTGAGCPCNSEAFVNEDIARPAVNPNGWACGPASCC